jgi:DNA helicase II / ATP-dependent DNA helicase PcrA
MDCSTDFICSPYNCTKRSSIMAKPPKKPTPKTIKSIQNRRLQEEAASKVTKDIADKTDKKLKDAGYKEVMRIQDEVVYEKTIKEGENGSDPTLTISSSRELSSNSSSNLKHTSRELSSNSSSNLKHTSDGSNLENQKIQLQEKSSTKPMTFTKPSVLGKVSGFAARLNETTHTDNAPHLIVKARAGTGKTTTLIEGLKRIKGIVSTLVPSPQQKAVWEQMKLSKGAKSICFVAFNYSIAEELKKRVPPGCDAMTMHSMGFRAVTKMFGRQEPTQYAVQDLIATLMEKDIRQIRSDPNDRLVLGATDKLVSLCKMNLTLLAKEGEEGEGITWDEHNEYELSQLASSYELDFGEHNVDKIKQRVFELTPKILELCKSPKGKITFDDMIWLPAVLNLAVFQYDLLLVDESQDLNRCQQALAKRAGKRLIMVGDEKQAIYGFAGADSASMKRMEEELGSQERGVQVLPLTVTRRCGKAIVKEAQKIVPDFEAHESNCAGTVGHLKYPIQEDAEGKYELPWDQTYCAKVQAGDMILCRVNAPLVKECFRFIKRGMRANIQGKNIGQGLISLVERLSKDSTQVTDLIAKLSDWLHDETSKEQAKRNPDESKIINLQDRYDCILCFTQGVQVVGEVISKINNVFTDSKDVEGIRLSSVHKSKGLEAKRVFFLMPKKAECPHPLSKSEWQIESEYNLLYVGITRAIEELYYVK